MVIYDLDNIIFREPNEVAQPNDNKDDKKNSTRFIRSYPYSSWFLSLFS